MKNIFLILIFAFSQTKAQNWQELHSIVTDSIILKNTDSVKIKCNEAHRLGKGFVFNGKNDLNAPNTGDFIGNQMDDNFIQLDISQPNGTIGQQGDNTPGNETVNGNVWTHNSSPNHSPNETVFSNGAIGGNSNNNYSGTAFYTLPNTAGSSYKTTPTNNTATDVSGNIYLFNALQPIPVPFPINNLSCGNSANLKALPIHKNEIDKTLAGFYFNEQMCTWFNAANWNDKQQLYDRLYSITNSPATLDLSNMDAADAAKMSYLYNLNKQWAAAALSYPDIINWYNEATNGNIGKFNQVQQLMNSGNYTDAKTLNNSITATLQPEVNQQQYNSIVINHYLRMQSIPNH